MDNQARLTAIIIDDEHLARENLQMLLEEFCPAINVIGSAGSVKEGKEKIASLKPQVVFLDIRMPSGSEGFELLDSIENKDFQVVFVTAFKDYAIRALNASAIHYILKPIDIEDLQFAVQKLIEYHDNFEEDSGQFDDYLSSMKDLSENLANKSSLKRLTLYHNKGFKIVKTLDIVRLQADGNCTAFYFADGSKYLDTKTLKIYEDLLQGDQFMRVHKSHMINLNCLQEYLSKDGHIAVLNDGTQVPIARNRMSAFLSAIKRLSN